MMRGALKKAQGYVIAIGPPRATLRFEKSYGGLPPMKKRTVFLVWIFLLVSGCTTHRIAQNSQKGAFVETRLKNVTQLTFDGDNGEAYFSGDDSRLIWQSNRQGYDCDKIWMMNVDGSGKHMVSPAHGAHTCSYFFPGDKKIVFSSTSHLPGDCPPRPKRPKGVHYMWPLLPYDIFSANLDGSELKRLTDNPKYDAEPIVSSDGKQIVFGSQRDGDFDVYVMAADGSNVRRLTHRIGYDGGPWFSPDGRKIVWRTWYPQTPEGSALWRRCMENNYIVPVPLDIWVMNADGTDKVRLTKNGATNWAPSWHPDGKRIIFSSNMDDWHEDIQKFGHNFELYLMNVDGSGLERLTINNVFDSFPMFSHDGKKVAFASNRNPQKPRATDIYIADWVER
jgi:Tol biopolymer transport system component